MASCAVEGTAVAKDDLSAAKEEFLKKRRALRTKIGDHTKEYNRLAMLVRAGDPLGEKSLHYLKGTVPQVRGGLWLSVLKTLSLEGLLQCLLKVPKHDKNLRKALIKLIVIKRLEQSDREISAHLSRL